MRRLVACFALVAGALVLPPTSASAAPDCAAASSHPYFNDHGTLRWFVALPDALAAARAEGKLVLIEFGRRACTNCRVLVTRVLPQPSVKGRIGATCVGLAADCDEPDPEVEAILRRVVPDASLLPFVAVVSPDLEVVTGWEGAKDVDGCVRELDRIDAWRARRAPKRADPVPAKRPVAVAPPPVAPRPGAAPVVATRPPTPSPAPTPAAAPSISGSDAACVAAGRDLLRRAQAAAKEGDHAEVLRCDRACGALPYRVEPAAWQPILASADRWAEGILAVAAAEAAAGRLDGAERLIAGVRRDAAGRGASIDADRGARAVATRRTVAAAPESERPKRAAEAVASFRGTRWEALFRNG